jgi:hypothetical protein
MYTNIFHSKALQNMTQFGFLVKKSKPSGNPAEGTQQSRCRNSNSADRRSFEEKSGATHREVIIQVECK